MSKPLPNILLLTVLSLFGLLIPMAGMADCSGYESGSEEAAHCTALNAVENSLCPPEQCVPMLTATFTNTLESGKAAATASDVFHGTFEPIKAQSPAYAEGLFEQYSEHFRESPWAQTAFKKLVDAVFTVDKGTVKTVLIPRTKAFSEFEALQDLFELDMTITAGVSRDMATYEEVATYHRYLLRGGYLDWEWLTAPIRDGQWITFTTGYDLVLLPHPEFDQSGTLLPEWQSMINHVIKPDIAQSYVLVVTKSELEKDALSSYIQQQAPELKPVNQVCTDGIALGKDRIYTCSVLLKR
ncbi:hypothetical protein [Parendozoicomonas haliclonae]|uniref:Uncharacterized protein n=1 Tax=Parendozoicomonas haliclonae TaxID=1960125 RepID=A0A1X7AL62_9GAMM|nr:hypothetical protein [Parendozoicomonas haliclonae]SMA48518.1 hypothetical protein EHSB41UT_02777 [Parendozoicomonas haliclonae]